jgi:chorismate mutase
MRMMTMKTDKLEKLRKRIDLLDDKIVDLLVNRTALADEIGEIKKVEGAPVKDQPREDRLVRRVRRRARKPMAKDSIEAVYAVILKESRGHQSKTVNKRK